MSDMAAVLEEISEILTDGEIKEEHVIVDYQDYEDRYQAEAEARTKVDSTRCLSWTSWSPASTPAHNVLGSPRSGKKPRPLSAISNGSN